MFGNNDCNSMLAIGTIMIDSRYKKLKEETGFFLMHYAKDEYRIETNNVALPPELVTSITRKKCKKSFFSKIYEKEGDRNFEIRAKMIYNKKVNKYLDNNFKPRII